ncbi:hypothetical protein BGZ96_007095 [Linnemannia gamsii]|uniref:Uncharacterized protein n=1 Tax=Linnemannia gamsii TaxID=64522 RepID=A0ABQ7K1L8_9FUNG|nr:hypothetical protein BGZ96_007095 [Linnemannia gamsii]
MNWFKKTRNNTDSAEDKSAGGNGLETNNGTCTVAAKQRITDKTMSYAEEELSAMMAPDVIVKRKGLRHEL